MSKANEIIRNAVRLGYTVDHVGQVFNPKGKPVNGSIRDRSSSSRYRGVSTYRVHSLPGPDNKSYRPIPTHRLIAFIKFGEAAFEAECVRHLNDNSLDNSWDNISIGSLYDNHLDAVRNGKCEPKKSVS